MEPLREELHVHSMRTRGGQKTRLPVKDFASDKPESSPCGRGRAGRIMGICLADHLPFLSSFQQRLYRPPPFQRARDPSASRGGGRGTCLTPFRVDSLCIMSWDGEQRGTGYIGAYQRPVCAMVETPQSSAGSLCQGGSARRFLRETTCRGRSGLLVPTLLCGVDFFWRDIGRSGC